MPLSLVTYSDVFYSDGGLNPVNKKLTFLDSKIADTNITQFRIIHFVVVFILYPACVVIIDDCFSNLSFKNLCHLLYRAT